MRVENLSFDKKLCYLGTVNINKIYLINHVRAEAPKQM